MKDESNYGLKSEIKVKLRSQNRKTAFIYDFSPFEDILVDD